MCISPSKKYKIAFSVKTWTSFSNMSINGRIWSALIAKNYLRTIGTSNQTSHFTPPHISHNETWIKVNIIVRTLGPFKRKKIFLKTPDDFFKFRPTDIMKIMNENSVYIFTPLNQFNFNIDT